MTELREGKELEDAIKMRDARELVAKLDAVRDVTNDTEAYNLITNVAKNYTDVFFNVCDSRKGEERATLPEEFIEVLDKARDVPPHTKAYKFITNLAKEYPKILMDIAGYSLNMNRLRRVARDMVRDNKKIQAIKLVREHTGWGLKEAKVWVDNECDHGNRQVFP